MANCITRHIPNTVTCCNLFSGCIAVVMAYRGDYTAALGFIVLGAVFDFFDGMLARALKAYSPLGKELDSLADDVTFGVGRSRRHLPRLRHGGRGRRVRLGADQRLGRGHGRRRRRADRQAGRGEQAALPRWVRIRDHGRLRSRRAPEVPRPRRPRGIVHD